MERIELWKLGVRNVVSSLLRSLLTVLGLAIGIGAILAVLSLGDAGQAQVRSEMTRLGIDKVWLTAAEGSVLQVGDGAWLTEQTGFQANELIYVPATVYAGEHSALVNVVGCDEQYLFHTDAQIISGRTLYPLEWESSSRCAILGTKTAYSLNIMPGDTLIVENIPFVVCGVIEAGSGFSRIDMAESLILPISVMREMTSNQIHEIMINIPGNKMPSTAAAITKSMFEKNCGITVNALTLQTQIDAATSVIDTFVEVLKWVALICILVGGVGVMNVLLVGVRERRREIGIMQSLGTTRREICLLFLLEAMLYATAGGIAGILLGVGIVEIAGRSIGLITTIYAKDCLSVLVAAVLIGLFFGVAPASQASKMKPVDALRAD